MRASSSADTSAVQTEPANDLLSHWPEIRKLWKSTLFGAFASSGPDGPQVTPIGSIYLHPTQPRGYYHPIFANRLRKALSADQPFELLFVNTSASPWLSGLLRGRFDHMLAVRLKGHALGPRRAASTEEVARWRKRVRLVSWTRGHDLLWKDVRFVQELSFQSMIPVRFGGMRNG